LNRSSFGARLVAWQQAGGRHDLPWQNTKDVYRIWLSEVMLQQTQVSAALPYYLRFLELFPNVAALARASADEVMAAWAGLGYYSRARSLHRCAKIIVEQHQGVFPDTLDGLLTLPGIGRSTAAAIAVFAFGRREAILDGNVKRVLCRVFGIDRPMQKPATERELVQLAYELLPVSGIEAYTQGLMDFGATLCTPRRPACPRCPFQSECVAYNTARIEALPRPKERRIVPLRHATFVLLRLGQRVYLERRAESGLWGGLWCLPHSPMVDVSHEPALARRFIAELLSPRDATTVETVVPSPAAQHAGLEPEPLARFSHGFTHFTLEGTVWLVNLKREEEAPRAGRLVDPVELSKLALPRPVTRLFEALAAPGMFTPD
jgi:A/G-specific adenine glycosylase